MKDKKPDLKLIDTVRDQLEQIKLKEKRKRERIIAFSNTAAEARMNKLKVDEYREYLLGSYYKRDDEYYQWTEEMVDMIEQRIIDPGPVNKPTGKPRGRPRKD